MFMLTVIIYFFLNNDIKVQLTYFKISFCNYNPVKICGYMIIFKKALKKKPVLNRFNIK